MTRGLLVGHDSAVADWAFHTFQLVPTQFNLAVGVVAQDQLVGAILVQNWNGVNLEVSYYGQRTLTPGIVRSIARMVWGTYHPSRVTVVTSRSNRRLIRSLQRLGFCLEGTQRRYYGDRDCRRSTGVRLVMFRERVAELAGCPQNAGVA